MKALRIIGFTAASALMLLTSCASNKLEANLTSDGAKTVIKRWQGMEAGTEARPKWIKDMAIGKQESFKKEYKDELGDEEVLPIVITHAPTLDEAEALAFAEVDLEFARTLSTRVNALVGSELTAGQKKAVLQSASVSKADFSGIHKLVSFWMEVETGGKNGLFKKVKGNTEVIYYYVCAIPQDAYKTITKTYLLKLIQSTGLDDATKKAILSIKDELIKSDGEKAAGQKQKEQQEKQNYISSLNTAAGTSASAAAAENLDESLEAAARLYGLKN